jgi:hypothetical protein
LYKESRLYSNKVRGKLQENGKMCEHKQFIERRDMKRRLGLYRDMLFKYFGENIFARSSR